MFTFTRRKEIDTCVHASPTKTTRIHSFLLIIQLLVAKTQELETASVRIRNSGLDEQVDSRQRWSG